MRRVGEDGKKQGEQETEGDSRESLVFKYASHVMALEL